MTPVNNIDPLLTTFLLEKQKSEIICRLWLPYGHTKDELLFKLVKMGKSNTQVMRNRIFYGTGVVGVTISDTFVGSYLTLYATDVLGIDALYFAALIFLPKIVDIVIDVFITFFVGKTRTRYGMYRPWLINMAAMVACLVTIFSVPYFDVGDSGGLVILVIAYFLYDAFFGSLYWIPYAAMPGVITEDANEIVKLNSSRTIFDYGFATITSAITMPILLAFGGHKNPEGWLVAAVAFGLVSMVFSALCFAFVRTQPQLEKRMTRDYSFAEALNDYGNIITDRRFILVASLLFLTYLAIYTNQTVSYYFYIYNLGIEDKISVLMLIGAATTIAVSLLTGKVQMRLGYGRSLMMGAAFMIASAALMMCAYDLAMMIASGVCLVIGSTVLAIIVESLRTIIAHGFDPDKIKTPLNSTIGLTNVFTGTAIMLGNTLGAAIISFSRYDASLLAQSEYTLNIIRYCSPTLMILLSAAIMGIAIYLGKRKVSLEQHES